MPNACDFCKYGQAVMDEKYMCSSPAFGKRGRIIYREIFRVLKKVGCGSAEVLIRIKKG